MNVWLIGIISLFFIGILFIIWKRAKQIQQTLHQQTQELEIAKKLLLTKDKTTKKLLLTKDKMLQTKDKTIKRQKTKVEKLKAEKVAIGAKYRKKLKAAEVKKKNLAKYHHDKKETRTQKEQIFDIIGRGQKWLPHSSSEPKSHTIGKPKGSAGGGRHRPEKIHRSINLFPSRCDTCYTDLCNEQAYFVYDSVITELSRIKDEVDYFDYLKMENIQRNVYRRKCPDCNKWVYPDQGIFHHARFGIGVVCYIISKRIQTSSPYQIIIEDMQHLFGMKFTLSDAAIIDWFKKFEEQIRAVYTQLEELLKSEKYSHFDETGLPMKGKNWWLWVICTANIVLYRQSTSRGHQSIQDIIDGFKGTIIADFFRAYEKFDKNPHQKCLAHLLSDIIELIVKNYKENERITSKLQDHEKSLERLKLDEMEKEIQSNNIKKKKKRGPKPKLKLLTKEQIKLIKIQFDNNTQTMDQATELGDFFRAPFQDTCFSWKKPQSERISKEQAEEQLIELTSKIREEGIINHELEKLVKRCEKFKTHLFTYLQMEGMPPDNNRAERNLRKFTRQRKISNDFKSPEVTKHLVEYLSLYMTCKANDRNFDQLLEQILSGKSVDLRMFLFKK
jgi:hypothetical protein